jgi:MFS family permease
MAFATSLPASSGDTTDLQRRRVGWSAFLGTTIEYYDFTLYGLMGPIVFGKLFFPQSDPSTALIAVLAIYAVGFFGRPVGGFVFSHYGDRLGRKPMMIISMTVMGLASTAMGLLPSYASIGVWAPILLLALRIVQGFALGGESAGANVLSTEVAPDGHRGFFTSLVTSGIFVAWLFAVGASTAARIILSRGDGDSRSWLRSCWSQSDCGCGSRSKSPLFS